MWLIILSDRAVLITRLLGIGFILILLSLQGSDLVDDSFEEIPYRRVRERSFIFFHYLFEHFLLSFRNVDGKTQLLFNIPDNVATPGPLVEQGQKDLIDLVDPLPPRNHVVLDRIIRDAGAPDESFQCLRDPFCVHEKTNDPVSGQAQ